MSSKKSVLLTTTGNIRKLFELDTEYVTGIKKMASHYLRTFLTEQGSIIGRPREGTEMAFLITSGAYVDEIDLRNKVIAAAQQAFDQMQLQKDLPLDETLAKHTVQEILYFGGQDKATVRIQLRNAQGVSIDITSPI